VSCGSGCTLRWSVSSSSGSSRSTMWWLRLGLRSSVAWAGESACEDRSENK